VAESGIVETLYAIQTPGTVEPAMNLAPYVAVTDIEWFEFLFRLADDRQQLDEVNFWNPSGRPLRSFGPGEPIFFRLKAPHNAIGGYGFFAHFTTMRLDEAWGCFEEKNGAPGLPELASSIANYRGEDASELMQSTPIVGCTILRDAVFWEPRRWIPWGAAEGWHRSQVRGASQRDPGQADRLLAAILDDHRAAPRELIEPFIVRDVDERRLVQAQIIKREGQGTFRVRLLDAYGRRCAITGERTEPVLDAAHIQPYLGPQSNHLQNGLVMTKEFHTLFDKGYVTVTPEHRILISRRLRDDWKNGRRYYEYDGHTLAQLPADPRERPSPEALAWHLLSKFRK
jgi:putative restriction endonuclease